MTERPTRWVSIDPGDRHVGFATWQGDTCLNAIELTPDECIKALENLTKNRVIDTVVCEDFELYGWDEKTLRSLVGNKFLTCRLIGMIDYIANRGDVDFVLFLAREHKRIYKMGWFTSLSRSDTRQLPWWGNGDHAKDAWCLGMWFIRERKLV